MTNRQKQSGINRHRQLNRNTKKKNGKRETIKKQITIKLYTRRERERSEKEKKTNEQNIERGHRNKWRWNGKRTRER